MEALISIACAVAGLVLGIMFLLDFCAAAPGSCGAGRRCWVRIGVKLFLALLLLHFHFELDILD